MENIPPRQMPIQISKEEIDIINDIRRIDFGKISLTVHNGAMISKEVTTITKVTKNKNNAEIEADCGRPVKREDH